MGRSRRQEQPERVRQRQDAGYHQPTGYYHRHHPSSASRQNQELLQHQQQHHRYQQPHCYPHHNPEAAAGGDGGDGNIISSGNSRKISEKTSNANPMGIHDDVYSVHPDFGGGGCMPNGAAGVSPRSATSPATVYQSKAGRHRDTLESGDINFNGNCGSSNSNGNNVHQVLLKAKGDTTSPDSSAVRPGGGRRRFRVVLAVLAIVLAFVVIAVTVLVLWGMMQREEEGEKKVEAGRNANVVDGTRSLDSAVCLTPECVRASAAILESLDESVDPCEDFYGYVCNGWIEKHPIPKGQSSWSMTDERSEENLQMLRSLLERPVDHSSSKSEQKAQLLYRSCLDSEGAIEALGARPLREVIAQVGGWNLSSSNAKWSPWFSSSSSSSARRLDFDLRRKLLSVQRFNTDALFSWYVREGANDTEAYELFVHQGGLSLPSKEMYRDAPGSGPTTGAAGAMPMAATMSEADNSPTAALIKLIATVVDLLGSDVDAHAAEISEIVAFESLIANYSERQHDITGVFVPLRQVDDLHIFPPSVWGGWPDFFNEVIGDVLDGRERRQARFLDGDSHVWIQDVHLSKLGGLISYYYQGEPDGGDDPTARLLRPGEEDRRKFFNILNNYLTWKAVMPFIPFLSKEIEDPILLHLVGGYADEAGKAAKLTRKILRFFHKMGMASEQDGNVAGVRGENVFHLVACCVGEPNSKEGRYYRTREPVIHGVSVDVRSGSVSPAKFNRCFVGEEDGGRLDEETLNMLLLGPAIVPRPERLKKMIKQLEDRGYGGRPECRSIA